MGDPVTVIPKWLFYALSMLGRQPVRLASQVVEAPRQKVPPRRRAAGSSVSGVAGFLARACLVCQVVVETDVAPHTPSKI